MLRRSHRRRNTRSLVLFSFVCWRQRLLFGIAKALFVLIWTDMTPGNYELFQGLVVTQARLLAFIDICFCLAVAAAIGLIVLALARWRQLHAVEHPHLTSIVGRQWGLGNRY